MTSSTRRGTTNQTSGVIDGWNTPFVNITCPFLMWTGVACVYRRSRARLSELRPYPGPKDSFPVGLPYPARYPACPRRDPSSHVNHAHPPPTMATHHRQPLARSVATSHSRIPGPYLLLLGWSRDFERADWCASAPAPGIPGRCIQADLLNRSMASRAPLAEPGCLPCHTPRCLGAFYRAQ